MKKITPRVSQKSASRMDKWHMTLLTICVLLVGAVAGILSQDMKMSRSFSTSEKVVHVGDQTFVSVENLSEDFRVALSAENEFAVFEGKTWIPVTGLPVELTILNDEKCGTACDTAQSVSGLRQFVTPALLVRTVDISSAEGAELREKFDLNSVPAFVLGSTFSELKRDGKTLLEQLTPFLVQMDGQYLLQSDRLGLPVGRYLEPPKIDIVNEPTRGDGPVRVVEFGDFQCPYSKKFHEENMDLMARLVEEGKITHVVKDFPLPFHKEAAGMHQLANCVQKLAGDEAYFDARHLIFSTQAEWSGKGFSAVQKMASDLTGKFSLNAEEFQSCVSNEETSQEVASDIQEGRTLGVNGTPTIFIGTQRMPGAISPEVFEEAVEKE